MYSFLTFQNIVMLSFYKNIYCLIFYHLYNFN
nr:MAG TPA: hypothetical protein [Caudoviricetes sp.]